MFTGTFSQVPHVLTAHCLEIGKYVRQRLWNQRGAQRRFAYIYGARSYSKLARQADPLDVETNVRV